MPLLLVGWFWGWWQLAMSTDLFTLLLRTAFLTHSAQELFLLLKLFTCFLLRLLFHSLFNCLFLKNSSHLLGFYFLLVLLRFASHPRLPSWSLIGFFDWYFFGRSLVNNAFLFFVTLFVWGRDPMFPGQSSIVMQWIKKLTCGPFQSVG